MSRKNSALFFILCLQISKRYSIISIVIDERTRKGVLKNSNKTIPKIIKNGFLESSVTIM